MTQIGVQPLSAILRDGPLPDPDEAMGGDPGPQTRWLSRLAGDAGESSLFVSPPPLPFPRVFPGL